MSSIPASELVSVQPGVLSAGGNPLSLNAIMLTTTATVPVGVVQSFSTLADVQDFFGASSTEALYATSYFLGYDNSYVKPGEIKFAQYNTSAVGAWLRGASLPALTLAQVQAVIPAVFTASIAATTMTVTAKASGTITKGMLLTGTSVTSGSRVGDQLTGTAGGTGTYTVTLTGTTSSTTVTGAYDLSVTVDGTPVSFSTINLSAASSFSAAATAIGSALGETVTYNSQLQAFQINSGTTGAASTITTAAYGALSTLLALTTTLGATLSQGAAVAVPGTFMAAVAQYTQNWVTFMTLWEPDTTNKTLFAAWANGTNARFAYVAWDTDANAAVAGNTTCFGAVVEAAGYEGVIPVYSDPLVAAFICGTAASLDFARTNGRITFAYKSQSGLVASVTDATVAANLIANGYNFYGSYATANDQFSFLQPGQISGNWAWIDAFIDQVYLNNQFQLAGMSLLSNAGSVPYNQTGYSLLRAAFMDPINQGLNFGSIRAGIPLSSQQAALVNQAAGVDISRTLEQQGFYLQILPATAQVRALRGSPPCTFWYTDGGSVQRIQLASIDVM